MSLFKIFYSLPVSDPPSFFSLFWFFFSYLLVLGMSVSLGLSSWTSVIHQMVFWSSAWRVQVREARWRSLIQWVCRCSFHSLELEKGPVLSILPGMPQSETFGVFFFRELTCSLVLGLRWGWENENTKGSIIMYSWYHRFLSYLKTLWYNSGWFLAFFRARLRSGFLKSARSFTTSHLFFSFQSIIVWLFSSFSFSLSLMDHIF